MAESQTNGDAAVEERRKALTKLKRPEADAEARGVGIEDPDTLDNIEAVVEAIIEKEAEIAATEAAAAEAAEKDRNPRFTREQLLANPRAITGYRRHFVAGALAGTEQAQFTKAQATKLVKDFLGQKDTTREAVS
jgi:hypothetical protein